MFTQKSWKLWPLAAFVALMALVLIPGGAVTPPGARADVAIDAPDSMDSEETIEFEIDADPDVGTITVTVSGANTTDLVLTLIDCNGCDEENDEDAADGSPGVELTIDSDDSNFDSPLTFSLEAICDDEDTLTITVEQETSDPNDTDEFDIDCGGSSATGNVVIVLDANGGTSSDDFDFEIAGTGSTCDDSDVLNDGDEWGLDCATSGTWEITADPPAGWTLDRIRCTDNGLSTSEVDIDEDAESVTFEFNSASDEIECTFEYTKGAATGGAAATLTASAGPNSVNCSGSSFITIVAKNSAGNNVADGTAIQVSTNLGSVNPSSATTQTGGVLILYTAPASQGGTATITARSGSIQATTSVTVNCAQAAPTQPPPPAGTTGGTIRAPSTGDGGLVGQANGGNTAVYASLALVAVSALLGALAVARVKA